MNHQNLENFRARNKNLFVGLIAVLTVFLAVLVISTGVDIQNKIKQGKYIGKEIETKNTITVSATSEVYAKPDLGLISFSVTNEAKTVAAAINENTKKMNAVIESMKAQGIETKDLKTTNFNIYPRYEWQRVGIPPYPEGKRVLVGYEVSQSLEVKIRDMAKIGDVIQAATDAGANQVGNLQFTIDNEDELKKQARGQAIDEAKTKAQELATQLGVKLVRIVNFSESGETPPIPRFYGLEEGIGMGGEEAPQIETGENKITVTVSITYEIN